MQASGSVCLHVRVCVHMCVCVISIWFSLLEFEVIFIFYFTFFLHFLYFFATSITFIIRKENNRAISILKKKIAGDFLAKKTILYFYLWELCLWIAEI